MKVRDVHAESLATSSALTRFYYKDAIPPLEVISVLTEADLRFMLVGTHAIGGWMRKPRATPHTEVLVSAKQFVKAIPSLLAAFPRLEEDEQPWTARLRDRANPEFAIDVIKPQEPLQRVALMHAHLVQSQGLCYKIPTLELALAMKFASMIRLPWSEADKYQEIHDFMYMAIMNPNVDFDQLTKLAELVSPDAGRELAQKIRRVQAGDKVDW